jgi:hypothetical protein
MSNVFVAVECSCHMMLQELVVAFKTLGEHLNETNDAVVVAEVVPTDMSENNADLHDALDHIDYFPNQEEVSFADLFWVIRHLLRGCRHYSKRS